MKRTIIILIMLVLFQACGFRTCPTYANSDKEYARSKAISKAYLKRVNKHHR